MSNWTIKDKTVLITGGARGMGAVTGMTLAMQGAAKIILVDWEGEEGTRTRDAINASVGSNVAEFYYCDLSSQSQVKALAAYVIDTCDSLDVLINNAGVTDSVRRLSEDGIDMHVATNHFAHFILTHQLLSLMEKANESRIIIVSSDAHKAGKGLDFNDLNNDGLWNGNRLSNNGAFQAYHRTKLCNLYFMRGLQDRLVDTNISVNALSPGYFVNTTIYRNTHGFLGLCARMVFGFLGMCGVNTPTKGARSHIYLAASPDMSGISGQYLEHCKEKAMSPLAQDKDICDQVWAWSEKETQCIY